MDDRKLLDLVNQSGYPLQLAVARDVAASKSTHGWRVVYQEHSWRNDDDGDSGFLDLVLRHDDDRLALAIECKRVREAIWSFLIHEPSEVSQQRVKAWVTYFSGTDLRHFGWADVTVSPSTPQSAFCVLPSQDDKSRPILERRAAELVSAVEALALEEKAFQVRPGDVAVYFSAIVTTAKLCVCRLNQADISISDGTLSAATFQEVPALRFRKQLSTRTPAAELAQGDRFYAMELAKEHTVFVINASCLPQFLREFNVVGRSVEFVAGAF